MDLEKNFGFGIGFGNLNYVLCHVATHVILHPVKVSYRNICSIMQYSAAFRGILRGAVECCIQ